MRADNKTTEAIHCKKSDKKIKSTEVLIVGFGFSVIPLIRELERDGIDYVIVSSGQSIWDKLEKHARLDFDLVSSMHSSLYSFELVNRDTKDRYPTSKEFLSFVRKYLAQYKSKVVTDLVTSVENHSSHSIVRTQSGRVFETRHLIVATAFRRRVHQFLNEFEYASAKDKTIVFTGIGDSVNLMISKLVPYNNRIVLVTNGFWALDKMILHDAISYTLDQLEYHNLRYLSFFLYRKTITTGQEFVVMCQKLFKFLSIDHLYFKYPLAVRWHNKPQMTFRNFRQSPVPNGLIAIKYWPIDTYQKLFDNPSLRQSIQDGYLLNDIAFFLDEGLIEVWPKQDTVIDRESHTIRFKDNVIKYDQIVEPDYEIPNLPEIIVDHNGASKHSYAYVCRNCFMGVIPKELSNIYFVGFTRPTTGGLNNITEMQCLFVHKIITDTGFYHRMYNNIELRIKRYNNYYNFWDTKGRADHLVHYGFYTDDIARLMKINLRLWDCRSIRDLVIYFIFPNTAFKYRQSGPYEVQGVKEMVQKIYDNHRGFSATINYVLSYALLQLTAYIGLILAYYRQELSGVTVAFLFILVLLNPVNSFVAASCFPLNSYLNTFMVGGLALTAYYPHPVVSIAWMMVVFVLTYVFRQLGWTRHFFNDLKNKKNPKYKAFFNRYCDAFREVFFDRFPTGQRDTTRF
jgi:hypothetical protein